MSTYTITMQRTDGDLAAAVEKLSYDLKPDVENIRVKAYGKAGNQVILFSGERYFFRNGSYASLTVMLTEFDGMQTADIIGSGGGEGLFNFSWGANADFAESAERILKTCGFTTVEKDK